MRHDTGIGCRPRRRKLSLEALEDRQLLSGTVPVAIAQANWPSGSGSRTGTVVVESASNRQPAVGATTGNGAGASGISTSIGAQGTASTGPTAPQYPPAKGAGGAAGPVTAPYVDQTPGDDNPAASNAQPTAGYAASGSSATQTTMAKGGAAYAYPEYQASLYLALQYDSGATIYGL